MQTYLYTGSESGSAVQRLAIGLASLQQPTLVVRFGSMIGTEPLAPWQCVLPIRVVRVQLPGLDWPLSSTPSDEVAAQTAMACLAQLIASGNYRLVILDGIREVVACELLDAAELKRLAGCASEQTRVAMT